MQTTQLKSGTWNINDHEMLTHTLPTEDGLHHRLPEGLGVGYSNIFRLDRDLSYIETQYHPGHDLAVLSRIDAQEPRMVVTLGLKGSSRFTPSQGEGIVFKEGYTSVTTFNACEGSRQYQGNQAVTQLRFTLSKSWLERYFGDMQLADFFDKPAMQRVSHRPISSSSLVAAHVLLNGKVAEKVRPLFRQGQAMAILASELSHLLEEARQSVRFKPKDRAMANRARDILFAEFKHPPSVDELAKRVGTNPFKLKQMFHHFFDNTPYGVLLEVRMKHAYQLLQSAHCSVGTAADAVGYQHASNFSAAFSKYFGFPPKRLAQQD